MITLQLTNLIKPTCILKRNIEKKTTYSEMQLKFFMENIHKEPSVENVIDIV